MKLEEPRLNEEDAFLKELQRLLNKYDAQINANITVDSAELTVEVDSRCIAVGACLNAVTLDKAINGGCHG